MGDLFAASGCCCPSGSCQRSTSFGDAAIAVWKQDNFLGSRDGAVNCTLYRTLTVTVVGSDNTTHATVIISNTVQDGAPIGFGNSPQLRITSASGGQPGANFTAGAIISPRPTNGYSRAATWDGGSGTINYRLSDPITQPEIEAAAELLSALVDWPALPVNQSQLVAYNNGLITTTPHCAVPGGICREICSNRQETGVLQPDNPMTVAGRIAQTYFQSVNRPPEFSAGGAWAWMPLGAAWSAESLLPTLKIESTVWRGRIQAPAPYCMVTIPINTARVTSPTLSLLCNYYRTTGCSAALVFGQRIEQSANGLFVDPPTSANTALLATCGQSSNNCPA